MCCSLITLGKYDYNIFFPILSGILSFLIYLIFFMSIKPKITEFPLILGFGSSLSMCLSLILLVIYKFSNGKDIISKYLVNNKSYKINAYNRYGFILLCSILDYTETFLINMFCKDVKINL